MTGLFTDRYYLNLILAVLFIAGIGASLYFIYSLPYDLRLADGYQPAFFSLYVTLGLTFVLGALTVGSALRYKNEIIVMRDRAIEHLKSSEDSEQGNRTTISLDTLNQALAQAKTEKDILQAGLHTICKQLDAGQGALYRMKEEEGKRYLELKLGYALAMGESTVIRYEVGEGLIGQCAASARTLYVNDVPEGYIKIISGLGSASPRYLLMVPLRQQAGVLGVLEIASFTDISEDQRKFVEESAQLIANKITTQA